MPPQFDEAFREQLLSLVKWRRDVRRFRPDPVDRDLVLQLIGQACLAPSVGNSQPWRFVLVDDEARRDAVRDHFAQKNQSAAAIYQGEKHKTYLSLKLAGLKEAPVHLAVFMDAQTGRGAGLGQQTMPETLAYSVVGAIQTFWLLARAAGVAVGWVSILDPKIIARALDVDPGWKFIAYLCVGYPVEEHLDPELERHGWEGRADWKDFVIKR